MEKTKNNNPWWTSKTKWAALLIGIGPVLATIGGMLQGSVEFGAGFTQLFVQLGIILGVFGIRDMPFINNKR